MDLRRHLGVLVRFRLIICGGLLLGTTLAVLALFKVTTAGPEWRQSEIWKSQSTVLVTQTGFPEGRVLLPGAGPTAPAEESKEEGASNEELFADPQRFNGLAVVYSQLAQSDRVRALMKPRPSRAQLAVAPIPAAMHSVETLPLLAVETTDTNPGRAQALNESAVAALRRFLEEEQSRNGIKKENRVLLQVLNPPGAATLLSGRRLTPGIALFLLVMAAAVACAYALENLYPRPTPGPRSEDDPVHGHSGHVFDTDDAPVVGPVRPASAPIEPEPRVHERRAS